MQLVVEHLQWLTYGFFAGATAAAMVYEIFVVR